MLRQLMSFQRNLILICLLLTEINTVLYEGKDVKQAVYDLMTRDKVEEI